MKRLMLFGLAALSAGLLRAKDMYWIGGTSGTWSSTTWADINGKTEDPTTGNYVCYVTNTTPVTITVPGAGRTICRLVFTGANHCISGGNSPLKFNNNTGFAELTYAGVDVAEGLTVTFNNKECVPIADLGKTFTKFGGGQLVLSKRLGTASARFLTVDVREGSVLVDSAQEGAIAASNCVLAAGTVFETSATAPFAAGTIVEGEGRFVKTGTDATLALTGDGFRVTGPVILSEGTVEAGSDTEGSDATGLKSAASLEIAPGATLSLRNYSNDVWTASTPICSAGDIVQNGHGTWTIGLLTMTGGTFTVAAESAATNLVFAGGVFSNATYTVGSTGFQTTFAGCDFYPNGILLADANRTYLQTGGRVISCLQANGANCSNEIFYAMTGGELLSFADGRYPQGVGLDLSGTARAELRCTGSYYHRLASGSVSHTIRLRDDAVLSLDYLQLGENNCNATGTIRLDGGVLEVSQWIGFLSGMTAGSPLYADIVFNGGVLRGAYAGNQNWSKNSDPGHITGRVEAGGARIDVPRTDASFGLTLTWPFVSAVATGKDGGLEKTGLGTLTLTKPAAFTGPCRVVAGRLAAKCTTANEPAAGTGDIVLGGAELVFNGGVAVPACSQEGSTLSFANCAAVTLAGGTALTLGAATAEDASVLRRNGHGVLLMGPGENGKTLGQNSSVTIHGGVALDAVTGLPKAPVFERDQLAVNGARTTQRARFLTCDANGALVPATTVTFDPALSTKATVAQVTSTAVTVNENAAVGALNVEYALGTTGKGGLTIADTAVLSIGSGETGSVAPLLLNGTFLNANGYASVTGGTIDFGASEGVIVLNEAYNNAYYTPSRIDSAIAGTGGLTIAAPPLAKAGIRGFLALGKTSTYSGGTWIESALVRADKAGCLGTGVVHVSGKTQDGGSLIIDCTYDAATFANGLVLAGSGPAVALSGVPQGALVLRRDLELTGAVTLADDAVIAASGRAATGGVTFSAPISGPGRLTLEGSGIIRFAAANTYAGGTVIAGGTLEIDDVGTLGTGPIEIRKGATLRFVNVSARQIANRLMGEGLLDLAGAAVTFADRTGFTGEVIGVGSATGTDGYEKTGEGTVTFTNALSYTGPTTVSEGMLRLGPAPLAEVPVVEAVAFRLDAQAAGSLTCEGSALVAWADADGRPIAFTNDVANAPTWTEDLLGEGLSAVSFDGAKLRRLIANAPVPAFRSVFFVTRVHSGTHPNASAWSNVGLLGKVNQDSGLRMQDQTHFKNDSLFVDGALYVHGDATMENAGTFDRVTFATAKVDTLAAVTYGPVTDAVFALGDYFGGSYGRSYYGDVAEVIAYDRQLTEEERLSVERYLQAKWGLADIREGTSSNVLPVGTDVTVAAGAVLDLAGGQHEIASLSGAGTVVNSHGKRTTLTLSSGTSVFTGELTENVYLIIGPQAVLDLGGRTIHVSKLRNSGRIVNGEVTADSYGGMGLMLIFR